MNTTFLSNILALSLESIEQLNSILNYVLIGIFVAIVVGLVLAMLIGFFKGIFPTAFRLLFVLTSFILCFSLLNMTVEAIESMDLSIFNLGYLKFGFENGSTILVPITTLEDTLANALAVILQNTIGYYGSTYQLVTVCLQLANMIIVYVIMLIEVILIAIFGNLIGMLLYQLIFKRFFAKFGRKNAKLKVIALFTNAVNFIICVGLFLSPFSSLVNIANQTIGQSEYTSDDEVITTVTSFLDTYNNSILAQTLFNWTVNDQGLTLDSQFLSTVLTVTVGEGQESLINTLNNLGNVGSSILEAFTSDSDGTTYVDLSYIISESFLSNMFTSLNNSNIFTYILPLCLEIALNSELLTQYVDTSLLNLSDTDWSSEIVNLESMVIDIVNSGIVNAYINDDGSIKDTSELDVVSILDSITSPSSYSYIMSALNRIDDSTLLSRAIPAVIYLAAESNEELANMLPTSWAELNSISWGQELSIIYDCLYRLNSANSELISVFTGILDTTSNSTVLLQSDEEEDDELDIMSILASNLETFKNVLVGEFDSDGNLINVDENGISQVYVNGERVNNAHYNLFDTNIFKYLSNTLFNSIVSLLDGYEIEIDTSTVTDTLNELLSGTDFRIKVKEEFNAILNIVGSMFGNDEIVNLINNSDSMSDDILNNDSLISGLQELLPLVDTSKLLTSVVKPFIKSLIVDNASVSNALNSIGLTSDDLNLDVDNLGEEVANLLNISSSLDILDSLSDTSLTDAQKIGNIASDYISIANLLDTVFESEIINPYEEFYDDDLENNYFTLLNYIFESSNDGSALIDGFEFKEDVVGLYPTSYGIGQHNWANSRLNGEYILDMYGQPILDGENGYIAKVIGSLGVTSTNRSSPYYGQTLFEALLDGGDIDGVIGYLESDFEISSMFSAVNDSAVFCATFGQFLDSTLDDPALGLINEAQGQTFTNVTDWAAEGKNFAIICNSIQEIGISLTDFDIMNINNTAGLNLLLHALSNSGLFGNDDNYNFNAFLYQKLESSLTDDMDLLSDPSYEGEELTYENAQKDFQVIYNDGLYLSDNADKDDWCSDTWLEKYGDLSGDDLINAQYYDDFYSMDYVSKICKFIYEMNEATKASEEATGESYSNISDAFLDGAVPSENLESMLLALNDIEILRMPLYHVFVMIRDSFEGNAFDLSNLNAEYMQLETTTVDDRADEIEYIVEVYDAISTLGDDIDDVDAIVEDKNNLVLLDKTLVTVNQSYVLHRAGVSKYSTSGSDLTVFQSLIYQIISTEGFESYYYSEDVRSKDQSSEYRVYYEDFDEKIDYNINLLFAYDADEKEFNEQEDEIHRIMDCLSSLVGGYQDFATIYDEYGDEEIPEDYPTYVGLLIDPETGEIVDASNISADADFVSSAALSETLYAFNDSDLLYDCVPNLLAYMFEEVSSEEVEEESQELASQLGNALTNANPYYVYYLCGDNPKYELRYATKDEFNREDYGEIDLLASSIDLFKELNDQFDDVILRQIFNLSNERLREVLYIFEDIYGNLEQSYIFHRGHLLNMSLDDIENRSYKNEDTSELTTFEYYVYYVYERIGVGNMIYNIDRDSDLQSFGDDDDSANKKLLHNIMYMTYQSYYFEVNGDSLVGEAGSSNWAEEIASFMDTIIDLKEIMYEYDDSTDDNNLTNFGVNMSLDNPNMEPEKLTEVLEGLNANNILEDVVPNYIQSTLSTIQVEEYTEYDGVIYAQYYFEDGEQELSQQEIYAGESGIPVIEEILNDFAIYDEEGNFVGYFDLDYTSDDDKNYFTSFIEAGNSTSIILKFLNNSVIYQGELALNNGETAGVDALFLYHTFESASLDSLITGGEIDDKILLLDTLINNEEFEYDTDIEGQAFDIIFTNFANLFVSDSEFDITEMSSIKSVKDTLVNSILALTQVVDVDAEDYGKEYSHRAYLSSEVVASLLEDIVSNEVSNIEDNGYNLNESNIQYFRVDEYNNYINDYTIDVYSKLTPDSYDLLNANEAKGLDAILSLYDPDAVDYTSYNADSISENMANMEYEYITDDGEVAKANSYLASVIYVSRLHSLFSAFLDNEILETLYGEPCIRISDINDLFTYNGDSGIGFESYGQSTHEYLNKITSSIGS